MCVKICLLLCDQWRNKKQRKVYTYLINLIMFHVPNAVLNDGSWIEL